MLPTEYGNGKWSEWDDELYEQQKDYYEQRFTSKEWKPASPQKVSKCCICNAPGSAEVNSKNQSHYLCETCSPLKPFIKKSLAKGISLMGSKENRILAVLGDVARELCSHNPIEIADILTSRNIPAPLGGKWIAYKVKFLLDFHGLLDPTDMVAKKMHRRLLMMEIEPLQHMEPDVIASVLNEKGLMNENGKAITVKYVERLLSEIRSCDMGKDE